ncbi:MAG: hypothetical protein V2I41_03165 [Pseudomonadales bacterium]|jgi:hypothetical protein|nr:hypothetical protein [Pseudomonadales bacterium]
MALLRLKTILMTSLIAFSAASAVGEEVAQGAAQDVAKNAESTSQVAQSAGGFLQLDETVISGNQELPKVLYILPWREPQGLPDIEIQAEFTEAEVFRRLYPPAYRRELGYFDTLSGLKENPDQEK